MRKREESEAVEVVKGIAESCKRWGWMDDYMLWGTSEYSLRLRHLVILVETISEQQEDMRVMSEAILQVPLLKNHPAWGIAQKSIRLK